MKRCFLTLVLGVFIFVGTAAAEELKEPYKEVLSQKMGQSEDPTDDDDLFSGITIKDGNSTIKSGTVLAMDPAALHGTGKIPREVLPYLSRSVVYASSGSGGVSTSETHTSNWQTTAVTNEANVVSGVTVSRRE